MIQYEAVKPRHQISSKFLNFQAHYLLLPQDHMVQLEVGGEQITQNGSCSALRYNWLAAAAGLQLAAGFHCFLKLNHYISCCSVAGELKSTWHQKPKKKTNILVRQGSQKWTAAASVTQLPKKLSKTQR